MTLYFAENLVSQSVSPSLLFVLRHGETDWNAEKRLQGRTDTPLNEQGRRQARRHGDELAQILRSISQTRDLKDELAEWHFVSSPLQRCRETMDIVLGCLGHSSHPFSVDDRLIEISFGEWEGQRWEDLHMSEPELVKARFENPWEVCAPGAETYTDLEKRVLDWYVCRPVKTIAVTHSGPSRILRRAVSEIPKEQVLDLHSPQDRFIKIYGNNFEWI